MLLGIKFAKALNNRFRRASSDHNLSHIKQKHVSGIILVGPTKSMVRTNITGKLRDGTGGWYVWGS